MSNEQPRQEFDLTGLRWDRPYFINTRAGRFELPNNLPNVVNARIRRWVSTLANQDEDQADEEGCALVARVLGISQADAQTKFLPIEREGILAFLATGSREYMTISVPNSDEPSDSSKPTAAG